MAVYSRTYYGVPGQTYIIDPLLSFVNILKVAVDDTVYKKVSGTPSGIQFKYDVSGGRIDFDANNPFGGVTMGRPNRFAMNKILVKWKI